MKILEILNKYGESRLVGGYVREHLLHKHNIETRGRKTLEHCDIDIATILKPEEVIEACKKEKIKFIPTGLEHGTITAVLNNIPYEITTLRRDVECDGRHAEIEYTNDWKEDAKRRDFTINAMSMDLDGKIYDYFNGEEDLKNQQVTFVGLAENRIREDYLRIMRYFRFSAYYAKNVSDEIIEIIKNNKDGIGQLSVERVWDELKKILKFPYILESMEKANILKIILPDVKYKDLNFNNSYLENLSALLIKNKFTEINELAKRLKISNKDKKFLELQVTNSKLQIFDKVVVYKLGRKMAQSHFNIKYILGDSAELIDVSNIPEIPALPVNGNDLLERGIQGKQIGDVLTEMDKAYIKSDFSLSKKELLDSLYK